MVLIKRLLALAAITESCAAVVASLPQLGSDLTILAEDDLAGKFLTMSFLGLMHNILTMKLSRIYYQNHSSDTAQYRANVLFCAEIVQGTQRVALVS